MYPGDGHANASLPALTLLRRFEQLQRPAGEKNKADRSCGLMDCRVKPGNDSHTRIGIST
jgi:hypothetical protein